MARTREYTCRLLDMVEQGALDKDSLINDLLGWMSEDEVKEFARANDIIQYDEDDEDEVVDAEIDDVMNDFNYTGSPHHY